MMVAPYLFPYYLQRPPNRCDALKYLSDCSPTVSLLFKRTLAREKQLLPVNQTLAYVLIFPIRRHNEWLRLTGCIEYFQTAQT